jgi:predicted PurR-regulated permease PerM
MDEIEQPEIIIHDPTRDSIDKINQAIAAVVLVLVIGFITMLFMLAGLLLDAWRSKTDSYRSLSEHLESQQKTIDIMQNSLTEIQNILQNKVDKPRSLK